MDSILDSHRIRLKYALALLLATHPLSAVELTGRVVDPSGAVVPGATIIVHAREGMAARRASSDAQGAFRIDRLPAGEHLVEAFTNALSARPVRLELSGESNAPIEIRLALPASSSRVEVTSSATARSTEEVAKALDVVDAREVELRLEYSLAESLRLLPGTRVQVLGGPGGLTRVLVRGMRAYDTSLLVDGFRLRDASAPQGDATAFLGEMMLVDSSRVEVLRGSGSSLYGTNAIGGVIHLATESGGGSTRGQILAEGGGLGLFRGQARLAGALKRVPVDYSLGAGHLNVTRGVDGDDRHRNSTLQGSMQAPLGGRTLAGARVYLLDTFTGLNVNPYSAPAEQLPLTGEVPAIPLPPDQVRRAELGLPVRYGDATFVPSLNDSDSRRSSYSRSALLNLSHQFTPSLAARANYQGLWTSRDNRDGPAGPRFQPAFNDSNLFDGRIDVFQARGDLHLGRAHLLTAGYEGERESFENRARNEDPDPSGRVDAGTVIRQRSHSLFAQNQSRLLAERLLISLSGRWQDFNLSPPEFAGGAPRYEGIPMPSPPAALTGDAAVAWFFRRPGLKFRAHAGNSYRAPSLYERFGTTFFGGAFTPIGDPRLAPERAVAIDAGFDHHVAGGRANWSATYFYTRLQEVIAFDFSGVLSPSRDPYVRFFGYLNTRGGIARGVELSLQASLSRGTTLRTSYTYTNGLENQSLLTDGSLRPLRIYEHMFTLLVTQRIGKRLDLAFDFLGASSPAFPLFTETGTRAFRFDGPRKADLAATYSIPWRERLAFQFYLRAENLLSQDYFEDGFRTPGTTAVGGLRFLF